MELGYVRLYRKILDNPIIWKDSDHVAIWIYLLLNATHKEISVIFKGERTILKPGQLIVGSKAIAEELNINYVKVHRVLNDFKVEKQIEKQASNKNSLITILNWEKYQSCEKQNEIQVKNNCNSTEIQQKSETQSEKQIITENALNTAFNQEETSTSEKQNEIPMKNKCNSTEIQQKSETQSEKQIITENALNTAFNQEETSTSEKQNEIPMKNKCNSSENKQECKECNNNTSSYSYLEEKYARMINSAEKELLDYLLETYDKDLVLEAIKQSAIMNKKNLNYAKGILRNWKKYQINNLEDLKKSEEAREEEKQPVELFSYNWLEDNE